MDLKKIIHAQPCSECLGILRQLGAIEAVKLPHPDCQLVFNQAVRVIAAHDGYAFALYKGGR